MAQQDQLEIISPSGELIFFELDTDGITNLGRDPSNDVVLAGRGVADFHLVLDNRERPVQVALIADDAQALVGGRPLQPGRYQPLQPWDSIEAGGYTILLVESSEPAPAPASTPSGTAVSAAAGVAAGAAAAQQVSSPQPTPSQSDGPPPNDQTEFAQQPAPAPASPSPGAAAQPATSDAASIDALPPSGAAAITEEVATNGAAVRQVAHHFVDISVDEIVLTLEAREREINVEEGASWTLGIANGGDLVAQFDVHLEGAIDGHWVTISPPTLNLNEGARGVTTVSIQPPRSPSARAGLYALAIVVTSPTYPHLRAQRVITLNILPFDDFHVGDVSPRQQTVSYFRRAGRLTFPIHNRGNREAAFRVDGVDDENGVTFEFEAPGHESRLVRQAELRLEPNARYMLPVTIIPHRHHVIGVAAHVHALTLTTTQVESTLTPLSVMAQVRNRPIVGPWIITATVVLLAVILIVTLQPRIDAFAFAPGLIETQADAEGDTGPADAQGDAGPADDISAMGVAALQGGRIFGFQMPRLPRLRLPRQLEFLNDLLPTVPDPGPGEPVEVAPVSTAMVNAGEEVTLTWDSTRASSLTLEKMRGGQLEFLATIDNPNAVRQYTFLADRREAATYILTARNPIERIPFLGDTFGRDEARLALIVDPVQPRINLFEVSAPSVVTGQSVEITWQVERAEEYELMINGVPRPLEQSRGSIQESPGTTTQYQLVARSPYWDEAVTSEPRTVAVALPTPVIRNFDVSPRPIIDGHIFNVAWEVEGAAAVTIDPLPGPVPNLQGQEEGRLDPGRSQQTFTLIAGVGEGAERVEARATRLVEIVPPTLTPTETPTPTPTPTATGTPIPTPLIRVFDVEPKPIIDGENLQVIWAVDGATSLEISPIVGVAPNLEGQSEFRVEEGRTQETFTLRAFFSDGENQVEARATRVVPIVTTTPTVTPTPTPTPTSTPQLPVIQVFQLIPNEVVRGDPIPGTGNNGNGERTQPQLTWTIVGEATNVEVTGPDFGPVRNLPLSGTLRVPATQSTVFQLNAYLDDQLITSSTQELTVLEPTPTPEPPPPPPPPTDTPTPTPEPSIVSFSVSDPTNTGAVMPIASQDDVPTYEVRAGATVRFAWTVQNPIGEVRLRDSLSDYGPRSPQDEFQTLITQSTVFRLVVTGTGDTPLTYERLIRINVLPIEAPPPPQAVSGRDGENDDSPATVIWQYPGEAQGRILGFRIYRANVDSFNFARVADRFTLIPTVNEWIDSVSPSCDRVYYVVAVYEDITQVGDDRIRETRPSAESWYTRPCVD